MASPIQKISKKIGSDVRVAAMAGRTKQAISEQRKGHGYFSRRAALAVLQNGNRSGAGLIAADFFDDEALAAAGLGPDGLPLGADADQLRATNGRCRLIAGDIKEETQHD